MSQIEFDEGTARQLEDMYKRRDYRRRRALVLEAVQAQPGQRILDVGCGSGFYVCDLLDVVGPQGAVTGVDAAPAMLAIAAKRVEGHANVELHESDVAHLPVPDEAFDAALSVQVLEYVEDVPAALVEIRRTLRPGGRVVLWDVDWATVSWRAQDPAGMRRMLEAWDRHLTHPSLPRMLAPQLREAGFEEIAMEGHAFTTGQRDPETYGGALADLLPQYGVDQGGLAREEADAWKAEQQQLADRGEFYFAVIQFCFTARKPA